MLQMWSARIYHTQIKNNQSKQGGMSDTVSMAAYAQAEQHPLPAACPQFVKLNNYK